MDNKTSNSIHAVKMASWKAPKLTTKLEGGMVKFGVDNRYPDYLIRLYDESPIHGAIVEFSAEMVAGMGFEWEKPLSDAERLVLFGEDGEMGFLEGISLDLMLHSGFYNEVVFGPSGEFQSIFHTPFEQPRMVVNENTEEIVHWLSACEWKSTQNSTKNIKRFAPFDPDGFLVDENGEEVRQLYHYFKKSPGMTFYPKPAYHKGFRAIELEINFLSLHLNNILNGNVTMHVLEVQGDYSQEEKDEFKSTYEKKIGPEGQRNMVVFNDGSAGPLVHLHAIESTKEDKKYIDLDKLNSNKICAAHSIPPSLGAAITSHGLNSTGDEYEKAYQLYFNTKILPNQNRIVKKLNQLFHEVGFPNSIKGIITRNPFGITTTESTS